MASDYRYDPFNNIAEPINITGETHVIPSNSPYTIRLKEVPVKESPSTVTLTIGGIAATEVAAEPTAGQFRCDYTTNADSDESWNTGLIQFNSGDACKTVVVAYKGMGTLASINADHYPAWWLDRGDGSDGDFAPTSNVTISGLKNYKSVNIPAGVTVTVSGFVRIKCQGAVVVAGSLNANGQGANGGYGDSVQSGVAGDPGRNAANGGAGGNNNTKNSTNNPGAGGSSWYQFPTQPLTADYAKIALYEDVIRLGSGGGSGGFCSYASTYPDCGDGGKGGGSITITADSAFVSGSVTANGLNGQSLTGNPSGWHGGGGGGGGGGVVIVANRISNFGTITANGGAGGTGYGTGAAGSNGVLMLKELAV